MNEVNEYFVLKYIYYTYLNMMLRLIFERKLSPLRFRLTFESILCGSSIFVQDPMKTISFPKQYILVRRRSANGSLSRKKFAVIFPIFKAVSEHLFEALRRFDNKVTIVTA